MPKMGLTVTQAKDIQRDHIELQTDVVVIGSGAGGAIMAYELAAAGKKVIVLESGPYVPSTKFTEEIAKASVDLYQDNGSQTNHQGDLTLLQGRCVGGSTVVNAAVTFRTPDHILEGWAHDFGLSQISPKTLKPHFEKIEKRLAINKNGAHELNLNHHILERGGKKLGIPWKPVSRNIKDCALTGFCLSGCMSDRKQSMLVTYLPWAVACGAKIYADTHVTQIMEERGRATGVKAEVVDPDTKRLVSRMRVKSQVVVLAAGGVQSPILLQKSDLANSSGMVGKNFACHPSLFVAGKLDDPVYGWKGALTAGYNDAYADHNKGGFILVSNMIGPTEFALAIGSKTGKAHMDFMKNIKYYAGLNTLIHDENHGQVYLADGVKKVEYSLHPKNHHSIRKALKIAAKILFASGAKEVFLPTHDGTIIHKPALIDSVIDALTLAPGTLAFTSYHPQGTCRMGTNPRQSVVSELGESHDVKGLFIADGSILPGTTLFHPSLTIYALASFIAERMIQNQEKHFA